MRKKRFCHGILRKHFLASEIISWHQKSFLNKHFFLRVSMKDTLSAKWRFVVTVFVSC